MKQTNSTQWRYLLNIKDKFENNTQKDIFFLYLIVLLFCSMVYAFSKNILEIIIPSQYEQPFHLQSIVNPPLNIKKLTDSESLVYINKNIQKYQIFLREIKITQNTIDIKVDGSFNNVINFLSNVSQNFTINQFEISKKDDSIHLTLRLSKKFSMSKTEYKELEKIANPFVSREVSQASILSNLKIDAIIGLEILVNNNWYKKDDMINEFKIIEVRKTTVLLYNTIKHINIIKGINYE